MKKLYRFGRIILSILREIADQNAYARYLAYHGLAHSPAEWRRFTEHHLKVKYGQAKCC